MCAFFCLYHWRVLTAAHPYPTQGYQELQQQATTRSVLRSWRGISELKQVISLIDRFSLFIVSSILNLRKTLFQGYTRTRVRKYISYGSYRTIGYRYERFTYVTGSSLENTPGIQKIVPYGTQPWKFLRPEEKGGGCSTLQCTGTLGAGLYRYYSE